MSTIQYKKSSLLVPIIRLVFDKCQKQQFIASYLSKNWVRELLVQYIKCEESAITKFMH